MCNGQSLQIAQNTALFSLLGTTYGGDGRVTFDLPNLKGRVMLHQGTGPGLPTFRIGQRSGIETNVISASQMPSHFHGVAIPVSDGAAASDSPAGHYLTNAPDDFYAGAATANEHYGASGITSGATGGGQAVNNMAPYLVVTVCIAMVGTYPSRS